MSVRRRTNRATGMLTVAALVTSGLMAVSAASGAGVAPAVAAPAVAAIPTAVSLEADKTVFAVGETVTLTATPDVDITTSGYRVVLRDETAGTVLGSCGWSSSGGAQWSSSDGTCTVTFSFRTGGAHTIRAYVAADTALNDTRATSNDVVVERAAWTVSLAADKTVFAAGEKVTLTATPNQDIIKALSYVVVIKDVTTGSTVGFCDWGHTGSWQAEAGACVVTTSFATGEPRTYQAYVAAGTNLNDLQATSNEVVLERAAWTVSLAADKTVFAAGEKVTLTATPNQNIIKASYAVVIKDVTTGSTVGFCDWGHTGSWSAEAGTCTVTTSFATDGPRTYQAYVAAGTNLNDLQAASNEVVLERAAWTVSLAADKTVFAAGEKVTLTATPNQDIKASSYVVVIKDLTTDSVVGHCTSSFSYSATWSVEANTCAATTSFARGGPHTYRAYVAYSSALRDVQAESGTVVLQRQAWTVSLAADKTVFAAGEKVALTATPNQNIIKASYVVVIKDVTTGSTVGFCDWGHTGSWSAEDNTCTVTTSFESGGPRTYQAYVAYDTALNDVQAESNPVVLRRAPWTVSLTTSQQLVSAGASVTLTATPNQNILKAFSYIVVIKDVTTGATVGFCDWGHTRTWSVEANACSATLTVPSGAVHAYRAYVAANTSLSDIQASSNGFSAPNDGGPVLPSETAGGSNPSQRCLQACHGDPVNTATGEFFESVVDLEVPGLGPGLVWSRSYGSQVVGDDKGLGFGWSGPYMMRLVGTSSSAGLESPWVDVVQENGSRVRFAADGAGGFAAPIRVLATLDRTEDGAYRFVRGARQVFLFDTSGRLVRVEDLNGNGVTVSYDAAGHLAQVADDADRALTVTWAGERIAQVTDPAGRVVSYAYSPAGDLVDVTQVDGTHLGYGYSAHRLTTMTSATGGVTTNLYDSSGRVTKQTDPVGRVTTFAYASGGVVTVTDPAGHVTREEYVEGLLAVQTVGYGTPQAATTGFVYGPTNQPVQVTDPLGRVSTATYNAAGHRTSSTDPLNRTSSWTYDGLGDMTSATDPTGATWTYTFDERGNATGATSPTGAVTTVVVNADGTAASTTDPLGRVTSFAYDAWGYRTATTDPTGATVRAVWDQVGRMTSTTDARGMTTTMGYDAAGRVTSVTDPTGAVTTMGYDGAGRPTTVTDPLGRTSTTAYDAAGQAVSVTDPAGGVTSSTYDGAGQVASVTDPTGAVTTYGYDAVGRQVSVTDPLDRVTTTTYDAASQVTAVTYPSGATWAYTYDAAGQATGVTDPLDAVWTTGYDAASRPVTVRDPLDRTVTTAYDAAGRVTSVTRADGSVLTWTLDAAGQTTTYTDPSGSTGYVYDGAGRATSVTDPAGRTTAYAWDGAGYLTSTTLPSGGTATYGYDAAGRRTSTVYSDATPNLTWTYDAAGQVQQVSDGTSYTYSPTGLVASVTRPTGTVSYTYDAAGRPTGLTYPGGQQVRYTWDGASQLEQVTDWTDGQYDFAWTDDGQVASVTFPNEITTAWDWDDAGQNTSITTETPDQTELLALTYTFDDAGQLASSTSVRSPTGRSPPDPASTTSQVTFDPLGRLDQVTGTGAGAFGWDTAGRLTGTADGRTLAYDSAGQLASLADPDADATTTFAYDADGNRTTQTTGTTTTSMTWDVAGHLTSHTTATTSTAYTYDATGLRTSATTTGGTTTTEQYVWDTTASVPRLLSDAEHLYVYGLGDTPLTQVALADGTTTYLHTDFVGSVRTATEAGGDVVCDADYDPYGDPQQVTADPCGQTTRFGYAGQYTDPTGLLYLRHRYYDPTTTQFLSADPLADTTRDPYGYADGNPLQNTDPLGLFSIFGREINPGDALRAVSNFSAGFGDTITFGGTRKIRQWMGTDSVVDTCSTSYAWGGYTGTAASIALPGPKAGIARAASTVRVGTKAERTTVVTRNAPTVARACSFDGSTTVLMADGSHRSIEDVEVGDKVVATDPETGEQAPKTVERIFVHDDSVVDLSINGEIITTTEDHPFWSVTDQNFKRADELANGEKVLAADGRILTVSGLEPETKRELPAYNLSVDGIRTYHVGQDEILVHNTCSVDLPRLQHAIDRHTVGGKLVDANSSIFDPGVDLAKLARGSVGTIGIRSETTGNIIYVVQAKGIIGVTGGRAKMPTTEYTIVRDRFGELVTMHPGR